ncbi:hypothetical protein ERHA55_20810 [Erwinia rhapontici]|uniref:Membrane protein DUF943 n=1 Tax=Erwinia rhapontici TaxID=55212 RepID=A0ABM7MZR9_ERWRD|nr:DUF943 family protein [Erwinia rhapontici]BCQ34537.1 hypothetical protein ERHA53_18800 [Erwinia rhapontici]BCQ44554.1 hypothetical protein ERHA55_20810 [Erwinia rhapontici]
MINSKIKTSRQRFEKIVPATVILVAALIILFFFLRPVKIVSTVREWNEGYFFVDNFPMTAKARIAWWEENKEVLKEKYNMPFIGSDKRWMVLIGEAGDGFQFLQHRASDNDLICFDSLKPGANCAEKKWLLWISHYNQTDISFLTGDSKYIQRGDNAEIKRVAD